MAVSAQIKLVSVIIPTWNSATSLPRCLESLLAQSCQDFEVIVVDNGSQDGGVDDLDKRYPGLALTVHRLNTNQGYATANNLAARMAKGEWLALLNADAFPEPTWLASLMEAAQHHPEVDSFASRLIQSGEPDLLDGEGDVYHVSGLAWRRNHGKPACIPSSEQEVFSACGAAALLRKEVFLQAGGFDEQYFAYNEDVDLGFRLQLAGHRCLFVPAARVLHIGSASTGRRSDTAIYYGHRNLVWTFFKDMPTWLLLLYLPAHVLMTFAYTVFFLFSGRIAVFWKAKRDAIRQLPKIWHLRNIVQSSRRIPQSRVHSLMNKNCLINHWRTRIGTM
jgi:GT2 family glycosyltransferase